MPKKGRKNGDDCLECHFQECNLENPATPISTIKNALESSSKTIVLSKETGPDYPKMLRISLKYFSGPSIAAMSSSA